MVPQKLFCLSETLTASTCYWIEIYAKTKCPPQGLLCYSTQTPATSAQKLKVGQYSIPPKRKRKIVSDLGCHNTEAHPIVFLQSHSHNFRFLPHWLWREKTGEFTCEKYCIFSFRSKLLLGAASGGCS